MDCMRNGFEEGQLLDGRFVTVAPLNHGSFGMVFKAKDNNTGDDVAVKCITKADAVKDHASCPPVIATDERSEELPIHSRLGSHPNIVDFVHHFQTAAHQYMVLEFCGKGDLFEAISHGRGPLETERVRALMLELVDAVDHLHANGIFHRDIKPENMFLTADGTMKLGDFGLATTELWSTEFAVGSDRYMAPEQYDSSVYGYGYSPAAADIWAIGIVLLNVLFQRNPFVTPTLKDLVFADYSRNRESLFDFFPTMSQDTYNVIKHALDLNPAHRSLGAVREALQAAKSFTTNEESLDGFCTEQNDLAVITTAAREPLRTPSITSSQMGVDSFPWTAGLLKTPQKPLRQLSTIRDEEHELFSTSGHSNWQYIDPGEASWPSNVDSGLGLSYKSSKSAKSIKSLMSMPTTTFGSLPLNFTRSTPKPFSPYGGNGEGFSKSWADLWDEDEEVEEQWRSSFDSGMEIDRVSTAKPSTPQVRTVTEDHQGSVTPRQVLAETDINARPVSPLKKDADSDKAGTELPRTRSSLFLDKWSDLGNWRRARQNCPAAAPTPTPIKSKFVGTFAGFTSFGSSNKQKPQDNSHGPAASWRQNSPTRLGNMPMNKSQVWERKDYSPTQPVRSWELDNNWREHKPPLAKATSPTGDSPMHQREQRKSEKNFLETESDKPTPDGDLEFDLDGDLKWVAGRRN